MSFTSSVAIVTVANMVIYEGKSPYIISRFETSVLDCCKLAITSITVYSTNMPKCTIFSFSKWCPTVRRKRKWQLGLCKQCRSWSGPKVIKLFSCSTQLSMKFSLLINMKMPTITQLCLARKNLVSNLRFITRTNFILSWVEHELGPDAAECTACHSASSI